MPLLCLTSFVWPYLVLLPDSSSKCVSVTQRNFLFIRLPFVLLCCQVAHVLQPLTSPTTFFFFLSFLPFFRSLFFNPPIPVLQASAYRTKNASRSSGATTVLKAIFSMSSLSVPALIELLLFDARMSTGKGWSGCVSHSGSSAILVGVGGVEVESKVRRFCVR